jgi:NAD+ kinase
LDRYVQEDLQGNKAFNAEGLLEKHPEYKDRLKWWNIKLCQEKPQTFDIVLAV